jgi:hypothetical protein
VLTVCEVSAQRTYTKRHPIVCAIICPSCLAEVPKNMINIHSSSARTCKQIPFMSFHFSPWFVLKFCTNSENRKQWMECAHIQSTHSTWCAYSKYQLKILLPKIQFNLRWLKSAKDDVLFLLMGRDNGCYHAHVAMNKFPCPVF